MGSQGRRVGVRDEREVGDDLATSYASLFRELTAVFRARGLSADEACDFAQETLVRTLVHLKRHGRTQPDLRPLAHTIARRLYVERGRRARPRLVELPEAEHLADPAPEPVDHVVSVEERRDVRDALASLAPRHRRVVSMWMNGLRPAEIARELGIKRNAADALLHRARRQLASRLAPQSALGLVVVGIGRVRAGFRSAVDSAVGFLHPSSASLAPAGAALATAGLAALLMIAQPARHAPATDPDQPPRIHAEVVHFDSSGDTKVNAAGSNDSSAATRPSSVQRMREHDIGFEADTGAGDGGIGAGVVAREDHNPSVLGPVLAERLDSLCVNAAFLCQESG